MDAESSGSAESPEDELGRLAEELAAVAERIRDPAAGVDGSDAADHAHSLMASLAEVFRALGNWYFDYADEIFDQDDGAEQSAPEDARDAGRELRKVASDLDELVKRCAGLIRRIDELQRRSLYEIPLDELAIEHEYFAVVELDYAAAREHIRTASVREDVSRYFARELARRGRIGNAFRVVPVIEGQKRSHVAEYPGEGDVADV